MNAEPESDIVVAIEALLSKRVKNQAPWLALKKEKAVKSASRSTPAPNDKTEPSGFKLSNRE
jgi:DICT domain-containing protein